MSTFGSIKKTRYRQHPNILIINLSKNDIKK